MTLHPLAQQHSQWNKVLVIGYGNELRGDDAVGAYIARIVASWHAANVSAIALTQLTPELATMIAQASCVIFVDAAYQPLDRLRIEPVRAPITAFLPGEAVSSPWSHGSTPGQLLALSQLLYGRHPTAWIMEIPASHFQIGQALSPNTEAGMQAALVEIEHLIDPGEELFQNNQATQVA